VIEFGETVEIRHIRPRIIAGKRGQYIRRGDVRLLAFCRINIHPILGIVSGKRRIDLSYFRTEGQCFYEPVRLFLESGNVAAGLVLQVKFETAAHAVAGNHRRCHGKYRCIGHVGCSDINLVYHVIYRLPFALALIPVCERHEIHGLRRTGTAERESAYRSAVFNLADAVKTAVDTSHHPVGLRHGGAGLCVHAYHYRSGVFLRNKSCLRDIDQQDQQTE